jgi:hypothetical protein
METLCHNLVSSQDEAVHTHMYAISRDGQSQSFIMIFSW